jgi:hypothetical protein
MMSNPQRTTHNIHPTGPRLIGIMMSNPQRTTHNILVHASDPPRPAGQGRGEIHSQCHLAICAAALLGPPPAAHLFPDRRWVSTGLNLATLEIDRGGTAQPSKLRTMDALKPVTRKSVPKNGQVQLRGACACSLCLLNHRIHKLSICNADPYRACISDQEYQIDDT